MNVILATVKWQFALLYLVDIIIFSKHAYKHIEHVRQVLTLFNDAGMMLILKKSKFFTDQINYLAHVIKTGKLQVADHTADAIRDLKTPTTIMEVRSFLDLCNVFQ